jgi:hypothetical protein
MKKVTWIAVLTATAIVVAGCQDRRPRVSYESGDGAPAGGTPPPQDSQYAGDTSQPSSRSNPSPAPSGDQKPWTPPENKQPTQPSNSAAPKYPQGVPVTGKKGFVKSPYAEYAGLVDVRGFPPGTQVKCPYTQKIFIVP